MKLITLTVAVALALPCVPLHAQGVAERPAATADARLQARLSPDAYTAVHTIVDSARARGLPVEPLVQMALEGASHGADASRIARAVSSLAERMEAARNALGRESTETELVSAAGALRLGIPNATLRNLRQSQPGRSVALPLVVLADIVQRGVPVDTAASVIMSLSQARMPESEFHALRQAVMQDIVSGANPAAAASTRAKGILLKVRVTSPPPGMP